MYNYDTKKKEVVQKVEKKVTEVPKAPKKPEMDFNFDQPEFDMMGDDWELEQTPPKWDEEPQVFENKQVGRTWDGKDVEQDNFVKIDPKTGGRIQKTTTKTSFG